MAKNRLEFTIEFVLFLLIFIFSLRPVENYDFWFHILGGKLILETGKLPTIDTLSHSAYGTTAIPYEWLAQVTLFTFYNAFGARAIQLLTALLATTFIFIFRRILTDYFQLSFLPRLILSGSLYLLTFDFWVERPQSFAYVLFIATSYLIFRGISKNSKALWLTLPLTWIWTNLHASVVLELLLLGTLCGLFLLQYFRSKTRHGIDGEIVKRLGLFLCLNTIITILPPLGFGVYKLLWLFFEKRTFISRVIDEWLPLSIYPTRFFLYSALCALTLILVSLCIWQSKLRARLLLWLPFVPFVVLPFTGIRHIPFGAPSLLFFFAFVLASIDQVLQTKLSKLSAVLAVVVLIVFILLGWWNRQVVTGVIRDYPSQAAEFVRHNLKGNMFNEYSVGGYLLYQLYPTHKVFIDGRTDMYLPKVLPDYIGITDRKFVSDQAFIAYWDELVAHYQISYALLPTRAFNVWRRLGRQLATHENWKLVYWDDVSWIFVHLDEKNDNLVSKLAVTAATPYSKSLYQPGARAEAKMEYERMNQIVPSGVSTNALGYIFLEEGNLPEAKKMFEQAIKLNPEFASPYMNLGELAAHDKNFVQAIRLYKQAIEKEPDRGLAYLRLGQLIKDSGGSLNEATKYWRLGLERSSDEEIRKKLQEQLGKIEH